MLNKLTPTKNSQQGFTLTEVLIAILIFAVCLVGIAKYSGTLFSTNNYAQQRTEALYFAQQKITDLLAFGKINTTSGYNAYQDIANGSDTVTGSNISYSRSWTVSNNTTLGYKTVTVTVSWTTQDNTSKSVVSTSIIGSIDPGASATILQALPSGTITH